MGLIRIHGSATAVNCQDLVKTMLEEFGVKLEEDVCSIVTDGCAVMESIGKEIRKLGINQQLCFAHAIQLAVLEVLYQTDVPTPTQNDLFDELASGLFSEDEDDFEHQLDFSVAKEKSAPLKVDFNSLICEVRSLVAAFRRSPLKRDALKQYSKLEFQTEYKLILDCKTRWNSLSDMLERFGKMENCIRKVMMDNKLVLELKDEDFDRIKEIVQSLKPIKTTVEMICRRDTNLIQADAAFNILLEHLDHLDSQISRSLFVSLKKHLTNRRTIFSDILTFLHYGKIETPILKCLNVLSSTKRQITARLINMMKKHSNATVEYRDDLEEMLEEDEVLFETPTKRAKTAINFDEMINKAVNESMEALAKESETMQTDIASVINAKLQLFEINGTKGPHLTFIYTSMMSIPGTSVESERAFSSAGYFCTKFRSRLSDDTLDVLCFLRSYFQKID